MRRAIKVYLTPNELRGLRRWAEARGRSVSESLRLVARSMTGLDDPLLAASGMIDGLTP